MGNVGFMELYPMDLDPYGGIISIQLHILPLSQVLTHNIDYGFLVPKLVHI